VEPNSPPKDPTATRAPRRRVAPFAIGLFAATLTFVVTGIGGGDGSVRPQTVSILGTPIGREADSASRVRGALRAYLRANIVLELGELQRTVSRESLGARVDEARLADLVRAAHDRDSALLRNGKGSEIVLPLPIVLDPKATVAAVSALKDDLDRPAEDAKLDLDRRKVIPEVQGRRVDVYSTLTAIESAIRRGEPRAKIAWAPVAPTLTQSSLGSVEMTDTLGYFETKYATDHKHVDRTFNLRLAASRLNGKVIMPGEIFDFNAVVGPRDEAHGYRVAKVIADGELVDGMGGGTCQIAGTLHAAALFAGLEIVQRTPHTRPSFYIKMGLDAAVAYPTITLKLKNPFSVPVVLKETVAGGMVRAEVLGPRRTHVVTFIRKIDEIIPFPVREVRDPALPTGKKVVSQRGIPGFKVRHYRVVRDGPNAVREKIVDVYPPTLEIVHVGTGGGGGSSAVEDDHPEYVADEYLAITQGPGIGHLSSSSASGGSVEELHAGPVPSGMEEVRVAGRTGTKGWTKKYSTSRMHSGSLSDQEGDEADESGVASISGKGAKPKRNKK